MKILANATFAIAIASCPEGAVARDRIVVDIGAGELGEAVVQLGQQSGSNIGMSDQSLGKLKGPNVRGRMSVDQALRMLLRGKPARAIKVGTRSWRVVPDAILPRPLRVTLKDKYPRGLSNLSPAPVTENSAAEIIVTASKRETPMSLIAASVTALRGNVFSAGADAGDTSAILEKLPSVSSTHAGAGRNKLFIRGIADSGFTGPTQATVGQYVGEMRVNYNAPDPDLRLYDIKSVEILEGPQGTLYGAGSLGGIIRTNPNRANVSDIEAFVSLALAATSGGSGSADGHMVVNVPVITDKLAVRLLGYGAHEGGYINDVKRALGDVNTVDISGGRAGVSVIPHEGWRVDLLGVIQSVQGRDAQYAQRRHQRLSRGSPMSEKFGSEYQLANLQVTGSIGAVRIISSIGQVQHDLDENYDATRLRGASALFTQNNRISLYSTEHRLSEQFVDGGGWMLGSSYVNNRSRLKRTLTPAAVAVPTPGVENHLSEWAMFGELTTRLSQNLYLTGGARFSSARLSGRAFDVPALLDIAGLQQQARRRETIFLPSFALLAIPASGLTTFLRYQKGFRPGGLAADGDTIRRFRNDETSTIETGLRVGDISHDHFAAIGTISYTKWNNIQADLTDSLGFPTTANIGNGYILSVEGQISVKPIDRLTLDGAFLVTQSGLKSLSQLTQTYLSTTSAQTAGQTLSIPNVAGVSGRVAISYRQTLNDGSSINVTASSRYVGKSKLGVGTIFAAEQGGYVQTNFALNWRDDRTAVFVNISNVFNAVGNRYALGTPFSLPDGNDFTPLRPRTVTIGWSAGF